MNSELSSYTYFDHSCKRPGFLEEKLILDEPNSLIFAIGASTEEFPIFKIRWLNSRVNRMGTNLSAQLYLSSRERSLNLQSKIYLLETMPALYFGPQLQYEETYEDIYQTKSTIYTGFVGMQWDLSDYQLEDRLSLSRVNELQDEGRGAKELNYTVLENRTSYTSHYYEYYLSNPQKGDDYELRLSQFNVSNSLESGIAGQYLNFRGKNLFNIGAYSPPSYVFGIRYHFASLVSESLLATPQRFRLYLGGESDIRGFSRKSINNEELGYKTTAHLAMESRFNNWLPYKLQPLVLLDFAKLGEQEFSFNAPLLYSPGLGLRWASPFGNFRATVAAGKMTKQIAGVQEQVNVIFTYGREF